MVNEASPHAMLMYRVISNFFCSSPSAISSHLFLRKSILKQNNSQGIQKCPALPGFHTFSFTFLFCWARGDLEPTVPKPGSDGTETLLDVERLHARDHGVSRSWLCLGVTTVEGNTRVRP